MKSLMLFLLPFMVFSAQPDKKLHDKSLYPTVKISYEKSSCDCDDCKKTPGQAVASGFIVKSWRHPSKNMGDKFLNAVVTASHNVENVSSSVNVSVGTYEKWSRLKDFQVYQAMVYGVSPSRDMAVLIFLSDRAMPCVDMDMDGDVYFGTNVFKIGYGLGDDVRMDDGQITSVETRQPQKLKGFMRSNCYTIFGDSGGTLFTRDNHNVIGITSSIRGSESMFLNNQSYFSPINWLKSWDEDTKGSLSFIYKESKTPQTLIYQLWLREFEIKGTRQ